jgi:hypothetical protein
VTENSKGELEPLLNESKPSDGPAWTEKSSGSSALTVTRPGLHTLAVTIRFRLRFRFRLDSAFDSTAVSTRFRLGSGFDSVTVSTRTRFR